MAHAGAAVAADGLSDAASATGKAVAGTLASGAHAAANPLDTGAKALDAARNPVSSTLSVAKAVGKAGGLGKSAIGFGDAPPGGRVRRTSAGRVPITAAAEMSSPSVTPGYSTESGIQDDDDLSPSPKRAPPARKKTMTRQQMTVMKKAAAKKKAGKEAAPPPQDAPGAPASPSTPAVDRAAAQLQAEIAEKAKQKKAQKAAMMKKMKEMKAAADAKKVSAASSVNKAKLDGLLAKKRAEGGARKQKAAEDARTKSKLDVHLKQQAQKAKLGKQDSSGYASHTELEAVQQQAGAAVVAGAIGSLITSAGSGGASGTDLVKASTSAQPAVVKKQSKERVKQRRKELQELQGQDRSAKQPKVLGQLWTKEAKALDKQAKEASDARPQQAAQLWADALARYERGVGLLQAGLAQESENPTGKIAQDIKLRISAIEKRMKQLHKKLSDEDMNEARQVVWKEQAGAAADKVKAEKSRKRDEAVEAETAAAAAERVVAKLDIVETPTKHPHPATPMSPDFREYTVLKKGILRAGFEMDSAKVGELLTGEIIIVSEKRENENGIMRVKVQGRDGWASVTAKSGNLLLEEHLATPQSAQAADKPEQRARQKSVFDSMGTMDAAARALAEETMAKRRAEERVAEEKAARETAAAEKKAAYKARLAAKKKEVDDRAAAAQKEADDRAAAARMVIDDQLAQEAAAKATADRGRAELAALRAAAKEAAEAKKAEEVDAAKRAEEAEQLAQIAALQPVVSTPEPEEPPARGRSATGAHFSSQRNLLEHVEGQGNSRLAMLEQAVAEEPPPASISSRTRILSTNFDSLLSDSDEEAEAVEPNPTLVAVFTKFDEDESGQLSAHELAQGLYELGIDLLDSEVDAMMLAADADGSGEVDLKEFTEWADSGDGVAGKLRAQLATVHAEDLQGEGPPAWTQRKVAVEARLEAAAAAAAPTPPQSLAERTRDQLGAGFDALLDSDSDAETDEPPLAKLAQPAPAQAPQLPPVTKEYAPTKVPLTKHARSGTYLDERVRPLLMGALLQLSAQRPENPRQFVASALQDGGKSATVTYPTKLVSIRDVLNKDGLGASIIAACAMLERERPDCSDKELIDTIARTIRA